mmetsp:Transcript_32532/g.69277  ORF Transcript_32532/g.69277 Transcript_32532/m.69277 type:complete len:541 (+) Transcript_32532:256-1878(+)
MTKISNIALVAFLAGATRTSAECADGVISTFAGDCTHTNFVANLVEGCTEADLFPTLSAQVEEICTYDAPTQFVEIQGTYQKDRRYFAGGSALVDGGNWAVDSGQITRFAANKGSSTIIAWPEYAAREGYNVARGLATEEMPNGYPANMNLYAGCELNTAMCCFTDDGTDDGFAGFAANGDDTTDVCHHELELSRESNFIEEGWSVFPGSETATHCVGFTWTDGDDELIGNMMYDISLRNTANKGYLKSVPGSPMCGCVEHMPVVEEAACRTAAKVGEATYTFTYEAALGEDALSASNAATITYGNCAAADLKAQYVANGGDEALMNEHLVGAGGCEDDLEDYLNEERFLHVGQHPTKYITPDESKWSELIVGEGVYWLPPDLEDAAADAQFRSLIEGGCKNDDGSPRLCMVRRVCSSCSADSHRDIYYQRLTDLPPFGTNRTAGEMYIHDLFMNNWVKKTADGVFINDMGAGDFALYSSYDDALAGDNAWTYCNYGNFDNLGFPRDCGPTGYVGNNWNSYKRSGGHANHHGFYVEKPAP